jgi:3-dehydroquinate dehydratase II
LLSQLRQNLDILKAIAANSPAMPKILVLNGPNLNLLGERETQHYGRDSLAAIEGRLRERARAAGVEIESLQSNAEATLIERIHAARTDGTGYIIMNPAAFTHTSVALRDALAAVRIPFIEVHLSNIHAREPFRRHSYFSDLAAGVISGLGPVVYELAFDAALRQMRTGA